MAFGGAIMVYECTKMVMFSYLGSILAYCVKRL